MHTVGERIKACRLAAGMTVDELADRVGMARATMYRYENGSIGNVNAKKLQPIATALQTTPAYLLGWDEPTPQTNKLPKDIKPISEMKHYYVPMLDGANSGEVVLRETNYDMVIDAPKKADYALRVEDEAMSPFFAVGDIVYIKTDDVADGERGVIILDEQTLLRRIYRLPGGFLLASDNPQFPPITALASEHEQLRILGRACGIARMMGNEDGGTLRPLFIHSAAGRIHGRTAQGLRPVRRGARSGYRP